MSPTPVESPLAALMLVIDALVQRHGDDHVLREGVAQIICGTQRLLDAEWGRLDMGTISGQLDKFAERIDFDLEIQEFKD
jgi:hypothetical protein